MRILQFGFMSFFFFSFSIAQVDWSKAGNSKVGDSPETGVQWVFITGGE